MDQGSEERAIARSDEPEARSAARWRGRAGGEAPRGLVERWPALGSCPIAVRWLALQVNVGQRGVRDQLRSGVARRVGEADRVLRRRGCRVELAGPRREPEPKTCSRSERSSADTGAMRRG